MSARQDTGRDAPPQGGLACGAAPSAAEEALAELRRLDDRAATLLQQVSHKLAPYRAEAPVSPDKLTPPVRALPPYFEEVRQVVWRIDAAISEIMRAVDETEL